MEQRVTILLQFHQSFSSFNKNSTALDADCKQWRLFADLLNDCALTLELCAPYAISMIGASNQEVTALLCVSGIAKSIVGVAGGATRAALTQHQVISFFSF